MFRTRDFVLYFTTTVFLLVAIGFTVFDKDTTSGTESMFIDNNQSEVTKVSANVASTNDTSLSREDRLKELREKIKNSELVSISEPESEESDTVFDISTEVEQVISEPLLCSGYNPLTIVNWPVAQIKMEQKEGARQYFTEQIASVGTSSSSTVERTVLLTLPANFVPFGSPSCLTNDIIGIALDGSLIRNNEVGIYSIFSNETVIGYALDGYPIHGLGSQNTDGCGGRIALGKYRYELSNERDTIINCFADSPRSFLK